MKSWMAERDRLLAQTNAFVKEVAAAHPKAAPDIGHEPLPYTFSVPQLLSGPPRSDAGVANVSAFKGSPAIPQIAETQQLHSNGIALTPVPSMASEPEGRGTVPSYSTFSLGEADNGIALKPSVIPSQAVLDVVLTIPRVATSERDDIAIRVSHFREHQRRLSREREMFSERMRARINSVVGSGDKNAGL